MAREESPDVMQLFLKYLEGTCAAITPGDTVIEGYLGGGGGSRG